MPDTLYRLLDDVDTGGRTGAGKLARVCRSEAEIEDSKEEPSSGGVIPPLAEFAVEEVWVMTPEPFVLESVLLSLFRKEEVERRQESRRKLGAMIQLP